MALKPRTTKQAGLDWISCKFLLRRSVCGAQKGDGSAASRIKWLIRKEINGENASIHRS